MQLITSGGNPGQAVGEIFSGGHSFEFSYVSLGGSKKLLSLRFVNSACCGRHSSCNVGLTNKMTAVELHDDNLMVNVLGCTGMQLSAKSLPAKPKIVAVQ